MFNDENIPSFTPSWRLTIKLWASGEVAHDVMSALSYVNGVVSRYGIVYEWFSTVVGVIFAIVK